MSSLGRISCETAAVDHGRRATERNLQLEGLRAIAILAVVAYHARVPGFTGGFVGVDVFFVLSGYLITGQVARQCDAGTFDLMRFWTRRLARLAPAGIMIVLATAVIGAAILPPDRVGQLTAGVWPALTYTANLHFTGQAADYHAGMASLNPLLHMWSLAVEGQFYLLWPVLILVVPARMRLAVVIVLAALSLALSVFMTPVFVPFAYYGLPTRLWELAAGGILALLGIRLPGPAALAGLAMIAAAVTVFGPSTPFPGYAALQPVAGAALAIAGVLPLLGHPLLVWIGTRSYAWYLWHWPAIIFAELLVPGTGPAAAVIALGLAAVTYRLIENPFREWGRQWAVT
ncbi:MAG: O-antigen acetylase [Ramlibacter sp.]|nr:O-antigen acetylase [Ramlibacter sp.]